MFNLSHLHLMFSRLCLMFSIGYVQNMNYFDSGYNFLLPYMCMSQRHLVAPIENNSCSTGDILCFSVQLDTKWDADNTSFCEH